MRTTTRGPSRMAALVAATVAVWSLAACGGDEEPASAGDHNQQDVTFAQQMIPHHAQALTMATMADRATASEELRALAAQIEQAQQPEIELMSGWLEEWGEEVPSAGHQGAHGGDMDDHGMADMDEVPDMPGMMDADDLEHLGGARGASFDRMWLSMMIEHHEGAVEMARVEQERGEYDDAVELAKQIEDSQTAEIEQMRLMMTG